MKAVPTVASDSRKLLPPFEYTSPATCGASKFNPALRLDRPFLLSPMAERPRLLSDETRSPRSLFALAALSIAVGAFAGLVVAAFRLLLQSANGWRTSFILRAHDWGLFGFLWVTLSIALLASLAAWLVARVAPETAGSGIPHVERLLRSGSLGKPHFIISVKFLGGLLAIGGGLVLGREGPSVQMGSEIGHLIGSVFPTESRRVSRFARGRRWSEPRDSLQRTFRGRNLRS